MSVSSRFDAMQLVAVARRAFLLAGALALAGLVGDASEGFPLTRSAPRPFLWLGAIVLGGAVSLVGEAAGGWILEGDRTTDPLWKRTGRLALFVAALFAIIAVFILAARFVGSA